ncbi:MAG TPA: hypothetical protein PKD12_09235 [Nitrospira sp.]|nr:hypothetical protein [Nitrospira sp.]
MNIDKCKVPVSTLALAIDPGQLGFEDTGELEPLTEIIGRERVVEGWGEGEKQPSRHIITEP